MRPHVLPKLRNTLRIVMTLAMARTFGRYRHSGWNGINSYACYAWRGREWSIPTAANDFPQAPEATP